MIVPICCMMDQDGYWYYYDDHKDIKKKRLSHSSLSKFLYILYPHENKLISKEG